MTLYADGLPSLTPLIAKSEGPPSADPAASGEVTEPWPECLRGAIVEGFSLVLYEGGSVDDLDACARSRAVAALRSLAGGEWVSYILGAPEFVNAAFRELYPGGLAPATPPAHPARPALVRHGRRSTCRQLSAVAPLVCVRGMLSGGQLSSSPRSGPAAGGPSLLATSGARAGSPSGNTAAKSSFTKSGAPRMYGTYSPSTSA